MMQTPIVAMVWEGLEAIDTIRKLVGVTKGRAAEAGSIRGDFAMSQSNNLIHASDSVDGAAKEAGLIFSKKDLFEYESGVECLVYSGDEMGK
jgi:nucleoside-diphosphate kinase